MQEIEQIYKKYYTVVYKYLFCLTHNSDIAEELTQETFYKMIKKIDTFKGNSKLSVWLCEIAKNLWYDELRKKKYQTVSYDEIEVSDSTAYKQNVENNYINKEEFDETTKRIETLDNLSKRVLYLRLNSDMSFKEIGDILGKTETWARVTFYRAKQKIKEDCSDGK
ncbi:MAG: RNA polymerase sigma factor [Clostridia bacterium]|nr:RNA polymerase sigma factor [Clostridia bacterium]